MSTCVMEEGAWSPVSQGAGEFGRRRSPCGCLVTAPDRRAEESAAVSSDLCHCVGRGCSEWVSMQDALYGWFGVPSLSCRIPPAPRCPDHEKVRGERSGTCYHHCCKRTDTIDSARWEAV